MKTDQYVDSICNLSEDEWDAILESAESYLGSKTGKVQGGESNEENNNPFPIFAHTDLLARPYDQELKRDVEFAERMF